MFVWVYVCMDVCTYVCMYVCIYVWPIPTNGRATGHPSIVANRICCGQSTAVVAQTQPKKSFLVNFRGLRQKRWKPGFPTIVGHDLFDIFAFLKGHTAVTL